MTPVGTLFAAALLLSGCSRNSIEEPSTALPPALTYLYRADTVTVIFSVSETNIPASGKIKLELDVHAPPDAPVIFPEMALLVEPFLMIDHYAAPPQTLPNGKHLHRRTWMLVPAVSGRSAFRPIEIQAGSVTVVTEPVAVEVVSLLPEGTDALEIKDISGPVLLFSEERHQRIRLFYFIALIGGMGVLALAVKRARRKKPLPALTPFETAQKALKDLSEEDTIRLQQLTGLLLAFIADHFGLQTSGKTLNELLPALSQEPLRTYAPTMEQYLTDCEQFRFSNRIPPGFPAQYEEYIRALIEDLEEVP